MRLPFRKNYMEICFHVIVTVWILAGTIWLLFRLSEAKNVILRTAGGFLAVFAPLFWAIFFALLLEPPVAFFQKKCETHFRSRNRKIGTALAYLCVFGFLGVLSTLLARRLGNADLEGIALQINGYIRQMGDILVLLNLKLAEYGILQNVEGLLSAWTEQATAWIEGKILGIAGILPRLGSNFLDILIGGAAAFYFLMEKERMLQILRAFSAAFLGKRFTDGASAAFHEIYAVFSGYLSGQLLDAGIMAVLFSAAFLVVGLPQAVLLGLLSGFSNLIPYFGAIVAFLLAVFSGLFSGTPLKALYASILILLLQQIDSIFIVPKAVGKRVELHPVLVLLSLAVFGRLLGFWGLLLAVPLGALLKNCILRGYRKRAADKDHRN